MFYSQSEIIFVFVLENRTVFQLPRFLQTRISVRSFAPKQLLFKGLVWDLPDEKKYLPRLKINAIAFV